MFTLVSIYLRFEFESTVQVGRGQHYSVVYIVKNTHNVSLRLGDIKMSYLIYLRHIY